MKKLIIWIKNLFKRKDKSNTVSVLEYYKPAEIPTGISQSEHLTRNLKEYRKSKKPLSYSDYNSPSGSNWGIPLGYIGGIDPYQDNNTPNDVNVTKSFSGFGGGDFGGAGAGGDWGSSSDSSSSSYDSGSSSYDSGSSYDSSSSD